MPINKLKITKKEILEQIDKNVNGTYPKCKIKELLYIHGDNILRRCYTSLESKQQIRAIYDIIENTNYIYVRYPSYNLENRMLDTMCKKDPYFGLYRLIREKIYSGFKDDDEIYNFIRSIRHSFKNKKNKYKEILPKNICNQRLLFAQTLGYYLSNSILKKNKILNYLDVGAGDGMKTNYFAKEIGLKEKDVYAIDFTNFHSSDYEKDRNKNINFYDIESSGEKYPFEDNSFYLTTAIMVLHHTENLEFTLSEINRVTKMGKYFVLVEHNNFTCVDNMIADIEHAMYEIVWSKKPNYNFRRTSYTRYYNWIEWDIIMTRFGFKWDSAGHIKYSVAPLEVSTSPFYAIYKKVEEIN